MDGVADCAVELRALAAENLNGNPGEEHQRQDGGQGAEDGGPTADWRHVPTVLSADRNDRKLLADLSRQPIVDLGVTRDGSFRAAGRIGIYRVAATFAVHPTPLILKVSDQFVPLHARGAPT